MNSLDWQMVKPETCQDSKGLIEICDLLVKRMKTLSIWKENIAQEFDLLLVNIHEI